MKDESYYCPSTGGAAKMASRGGLKPRFRRGPGSRFESYPLHHNQVSQVSLVLERTT